jgi:hypothetical protein
MADMADIPSQTITSEIIGSNVHLGVSPEVTATASFHEDLEAAITTNPYESAVSQLTRRYFATPFFSKYY